MTREDPNHTFIRSTYEEFQRIAPAIAEAEARAHEILSAPWMADLRERALELAKVLENWDRPGFGEPPNWWPSCFREDGEYSERRVQTAYSIMLDEGIPLAWVPRPEILNELLVAPDRPARRQVLISRRAEVTEDCTVLLGRLTDPNITHLVTAAEHAIHALQVGADEPAQSHATNTLERALREVSIRGRYLTGKNGQFYHDHAHKELKRQAVSDDVRLGDYRACCVLSPLASAWTPYHGGPNVPSEYNRHATTHAVGSPIQFTEANALVSIMLVASLLCEIQESGW